jgi:hypothetical protein
MDDTRVSKIEALLNLLVQKALIKLERANILGLDWKGKITFKEKNYREIRLGD